MKLYYLSGSTLPSSRANAVHVMKMCSAFAGTGAEVTLFGKEGGAASVAEIKAYYNTRHDFNLTLSRNIKIKGFSGLWRVLSMIPALMMARKDTVIYGRDPAGVLLASYVSSSPVYFEAHEIPRRKIQRKIQKKILQKAQGAIVISQALKEDILELYPFMADRKILVAHDGADAMPVLNSAEPYALKGRKGALNIGYTGSLHKGKGAEIIPLMAEKLPEHDFHIFGGQPEQVETAVKAENVYYYGHVPHADIPVILNNMDIMLAPFQPAITIAAGADIARWTSPLKIFEYMAAEKAVLVSDLPVLHEILEDGKTCLFCPAGNVDVWVQNIRRLSMDKNLCLALGAACKAEFEASYSWARRAEKIRTFF